MTEKSITTNPKVMRGKLVILGTHITVETILEKIASGECIDQILADFPSLRRAEVLGAVEYALRVLRLEV